MILQCVQRINVYVYAISKYNHFRRWKPITDCAKTPISRLIIDQSTINILLVLAQRLYKSLWPKLYYPLYIYPSYKNRFITDIVTPVKWSSVGTNFIIGSEKSSIPLIWLSYYSLLTHWGRVMHTYVNKLAIIGSDNGWSPGRRGAIILTRDGILSIWPLPTNISGILTELHTFSFKRYIQKFRLENDCHFVLSSLC